MPPAAPLPKNEVKRLKVLWQYDVLDTVPEEVFDDLTDLAAHICEAPVALISLVDENRQWFKSQVGTSIKETSRDISFCAHAILSDGLLVVSDAAKDPRFRDNPMVTGPQKIRFYAGAPLVTPDGHALGTLCVLDKKPRKLRPEQMKALRVLAHHVVSQLELRRHARELAETRQDGRKHKGELARARAEIERLRRQLERFQNRPARLKRARR
ncbi:MAG TPA: GAF domain-containing protein [Verrucomicrobiae bacterium]|nr:GAF domain-containing protein [Verrucomicrobiae bacterium]